MTHRKEDERRTAELSAAFLKLDEKGKDCALAILDALGFAQSVTRTQAHPTTDDSGSPEASGTK